MRCLLDKVTARHIMEGMLKLVEGRTVTSTELFALYFYQRAHSDGILNLNFKRLLRKPWKIIWKRVKD